MNNSEKASMRLAIDLHACQTAGSAKRGVGRYSRALFEALLKTNSKCDIRAIVGSSLPHDVDLFPLSEGSVARLPTLPDWHSRRSFNGGEQDNLDALAYSSWLAPLAADIVHVSHAFEGFGDRVALPAPGRRSAGQVISSTLYDLIPLLFQDFYFQNADFRKWYLARLAWLRQADLLLAISESSRQDAIEMLGIEPWRVVTIHGGISSHFLPAQDTQVVRRDLGERYRLRPRFVVYTGGDDHRKNIGGAIAGYGELPVSIRRECQLVIVCAMEDHRRQMYLDIAKKAGIEEEEILITGFIPERDLVAFYQTCDAFVFPSLYEGLGLPVLEAMACGAPVIGGNNSSVKELIARQDALFDAHSAQAIGGALSRVLSDRSFADELRCYGMARAKDYSWERTAMLAMEAFGEASARTRDFGAQVALQGWLPRKRLAVLTPLPPCRSGIADYNAKFLPYLARHFQIDLYVDGYEVSDEELTSSFRIFNVAEFEKVAPNYDAILYEFGNSEFHYHMLPLLEKYPGVVGLHDAYLSGMFGYLDFHLGNSGSYAREMIAAHGPRARRFFAPSRRHPEPNGGSMIALPCTKRVLSSATGIISHSPFNLHLAAENFPERWAAPYRIVPQMVPLGESWSPQQIAEAKKALGFQPDDRIVATFGHIAWTKWGDRLLDAFLSSSLAEDSRVHLVFAGELARDDFGRNLEGAVAASGVAKRIHITGFLSEENYAKFLRIADVAVQLRTMSRGGTPKGVLDCLANGVPVIINNSASYEDYPDDVVHKLTPEPEVSEIAEALVALVSDEQERRRLAERGRSYVATRHDPSRCAAEYAAAIHEFGQRSRQLEPDHYAAAFAPHVAACDDLPASTGAAVAWLGAITTRSFERRRLIIDVSHIAQSDHGTGIQRVVREVVSALYCSERPGFEPVAVELVDGALKPATAWLQKLGLLLPSELGDSDLHSAIQFRAGDVLLMLDSSWARYREFFPLFAEARKSRVPIYTAIYDLLPMVLPPGNFVDGGSEWFTSWFIDAVAASDGLIGISRAVAEDVIAEIDVRTTSGRRPKIGYWHLGSDFAAATRAKEASAKVSALPSRRYLLMVGTVEPRKSHALALDAMERLWDKGHELCLCIAGKEGWMVAELMERLRTHPLANKKLFCLESPSDADIAYLYQNAAGLLFLSKGEGFGLPLVEAANVGTPIVCSDIPVFHEIAGDYATYIDIKSEDAVRVAGDIGRWWQKYKAGKLNDTRLMPRLSWQQSSEQLLDVALDNHWLRSWQ